jgi:hypothetical protein
MRAGKAVFQRNREGGFVGLELPRFFLLSRILVTVEFWALYFLRTTTQPIE